MIYCFTFFENQGINEFNKDSTYGKNNEVTEIFDNKQRLSVKLEYNKNGQETVRKFGNGTKEETLYDKAGRVTVKAQKSERNELLWAEGYVYGDDGKRTATVDPIRDGTNWFTYVNNDPVNHIDLWGLCEGSDKTATSKRVLSGLSNIDYGANYDQIMIDIYGMDLSNGVSDEFLATHNFQSRFENMVFNKDNPLNQLVLDKALGLRTTASNTQSCQTTSVLNAWAAKTENGITGKNILNVLQENSDGTFGEGGFVGADGRLKSIWGLGYYMGKELGTKQYITSGDDKIIPPNILVNMSVGAIVGLQRNENVRDDHYVYRDWSVTIDSMDHTRSTASEYTDYSCRPLYWADY